MAPFQGPIERARPWSVGGVNHQKALYVRACCAQGALIAADECIWIPVEALQTQPRMGNISGEDHGRAPASSPRIITEVVGF